MSRVDKLDVASRTLLYYHSGCKQRRKNDDGFLLQSIMAQNARKHSRTFLTLLIGVIAGVFLGGYGWFEWIRDVLRGDGEGRLAMSSRDGDHCEDKGHAAVAARADESDAGLFISCGGFLE